MAGAISAAVRGAVGFVDGGGDVHAGVAEAEGREAWPGAIAGLAAESGLEECLLGGLILGRHSVGSQA